MSKTPGLGLPFGIQTVNPVLVDSWAGPYDSVAEANLAIPLAVRKQTRFVNIIDVTDSNKGKLYWYKDGITDSDLVVFTAPSESEAATTVIRVVSKFVVTEEFTPILFTVNGIPTPYLSDEWTMSKSCVDPDGNDTWSNILNPTKDGFTLHAEVGSVFGCIVASEGTLGVTSGLVVANADYMAIDMVFTVNNTIDMSYSILKSGLPYDMTGMHLIMNISLVSDDSFFRALSTDTDPPEILIGTNILTLFSRTPFSVVERYKYNIQVTDLNSEVFTIMKGYLTVTAQNN
jgi:hypothetical protein